VGACGSPRARERARLQDSARATDAGIMGELVAEVLGGRAGP